MELHNCQVSKHLTWVGAVIYNICNCSTVTYWERDTCTYMCNIHHNSRRKKKQCTCMCVLEKPTVLLMRPGIGRNLVGRIGSSTSGRISCTCDLCTATDMYIWERELLKKYTIIVEERKRNQLSLSLSLSHLSFSLLHRVVPSFRG